MCQHETISLKLLLVIGGKKNLIVLAGAHKAKPPLTLAQLAEAWAQITLDAAIIENVPVSTRDALNAVGWLPYFRFVHAL